MADRRSKVVNGIVNPAVMGGFQIIADTVTLTDTKVLTLTFPAKTVIAVVASTAADTDAAKVVWASSVSNDVATVTFTKTGTNKFSYIILATVVETIDANTLTDDTSETPVT
jgi:hypothetical protein